ncbi:MAG: Clp protease ClpP [Candidatus Contendobacter sp.]|nr:Clp protease ClpP [Candidatus Contendobacter sp.]
MDILIFDEITAAMAQRVVNQLREQPTEPVTVLVNSPGGDLAAGLAILNALRAHRATVAVQIEGIAASAATLLCCVGTVRMADGAALMVHAPWMSITGNATDLRDSAEGLDAMAAGMAAAYRAKTGRPAAEIDRLLDGRDHWFTADEALRFGLIDEITPARRVAAKLGNLKLPERFKFMAENTEVTRTQSPTADVVALQDAAAKAALTREQERRREIRGRLTGSLAKRQELQQVLSECLDDMHCTPEMASARPSRSAVHGRFRPTR